jgi:hypothetical protein
MQIHAVIDDTLFEQAIEVSGVADTQAMLEQALRVFIASRSPPPDMAGCLNRYARPGMTFSEEREIAWNEAMDDYRDS